MKFLKLFLILIFSITFIKCTLFKRNNAPFIVEKTIIEKSEDKVKTTISVHTNNTQNITFEKMYYNNQVTDIQFKNNKKTLIGYFFNNDFQLHKSSEREFGNKPKTTDFLSKLSKNDVGISYINQQGKRLFYKIEK